MKRNGPILRPDLVAEGASGVEVYQLTSEPDVPSSHVYMEAQVFTLDSKRLVLHRSAHAHGSDPADPEHRYLLCDLENNCELSPLTHELAATAPSVSPDGAFCYYFVDETHPGGGRLLLKRVRLDGTGRETVLIVDGPVPGIDRRPSRIYPLSTISSDGKRLAVSAYFGNGQETNAPWGLMVFDLVRGEVNVVLYGPEFCNMHPQYSRSLDEAHSHDILVQENHGSRTDASGRIVRLVSGNGADIHVIRDDGTNLRDMPWGRNGVEYCQGHQCWIGRTNWAITSTGEAGGIARLIASLPAPHAGHVGIDTPGGVRVDLSAGVPSPCFYHFATDLAGVNFVTDSGPRDKGGGIYLGRLPENLDGPLQDLRLIVRPRSSWKKEAHIHPFLSPDGHLAFFNSDETGILQAYMARLG